MNDSYKNDKDLVLIAVKSKGESLEFTNEKLKSDIEIVTSALNQNGSALQYVS